MKSVFVLILLAMIGQAVNAEVVQFEYTGVLTDPVGNLPVGTELTGEFSYELNQSPQDLGLGNIRRYELLGFSVSHADEFVSLDKGAAGVTDSWIVVGDHPHGVLPGDFFAVRAESFVPFSGTLGGESVFLFYLIWEDAEGDASTNFSLPSNLGDFQDYENALFWGETGGFPGDFFKET